MRPSEAQMSLALPELTSASTPFHATFPERAKRDAQRCRAGAQARRRVPDHRPRMKFRKIGLDLVLSELADLPSEWLDDEGRRLVAELPGPCCVSTPRRSTCCGSSPGEGQEPLAHRICDARARLSQLGEDVKQIWGTER